MKDRDLMACFNIILFYIEVSVAKGILSVLMKSGPFLKKKLWTNLEIDPIFELELSLDNLENLMLQNDGVT